MRMGNGSQVWSANAPGDVQEDFGLARWPGGAAPGSRSRAGQFLTGVAGGALLVYALRRRGRLASTLGTLGAGLLAQAVRGSRRRRTRGGFQAHRSFRVAAPVDQVFEFWTHCENLPRFLSNVREVRETGFGRTHWVIHGPGGVPIEWDAVITQFRPNSLIAWTSVPGSKIENRGLVQFRPAPSGGTWVDLTLAYRARAGVAEHVVAKWLGAGAQGQLDRDVDRFRQLLEPGDPSFSFGHREASSPASVHAH